LIIPDLNINTPLIDTEENGVIDFSKENFDEELTKEFGKAVKAIKAI